MNATTADIRRGLALFGKVQVQTAEGSRPLDDFTPYGIEAPRERGQVYRDGHWVNVEIRKEG